MERRPTIAYSPMPVVEEAERICDEFQRRRPDTLGSPIDVRTAASPMFVHEDGQPPFEKAPVEGGVMGDDEHDRLQKTAHSIVINAMPGDHTDR